MVPLPLILSELIMALGGAMLAANLYALARPRLKPGTAERVQAKGKVLVNAFVGLVVFAWGLATFVTRI